MHQPVSRVGRNGPDAHSVDQDDPDHNLQSHWLPLTKSTKTFTLAHVNTSKHVLNTSDDCIPGLYTVRSRATSLSVSANLAQSGQLPQADSSSSQPVHDDLQAIALALMSPPIDDQRTRLLVGDGRDAYLNGQHPEYRRYGGLGVNLDLEAGRRLIIKPKTQPLKDNPVTLCAHDAHETDDLLPSSSLLILGDGDSLLSVPTHEEPGTPDSDIDKEDFPMAFTVVEMGVHTFGTGIVVLLIMLSIWLTLADIKM